MEMKILDNEKISIEIHGITKKTEFNRVKTKLMNLAGYILGDGWNSKKSTFSPNYKTYIVASKDTTLDVNIKTVLFNEEINIVISIVNPFHPMEIVSLSHIFSSFSTDFLKTTTESTISLIDEDCWSPSISMGVLYIYFVNFFKEYLDNVGFDNV